MGTEVQSKMYFPGYCSIQNLSSNVGHGSWSLLHENTNLKNGQQYEVFLTRPVIDGFHGRDEGQLRQTILKHESIFRHQVDRVAGIAVSVPQRSELEGTSGESSTKVLHKYMCYLITMLGVFIQLKQGVGNESLFDTDYLTMVTLIIALIAYSGSLIGSKILHIQACPNSGLAESIINKISLLFGTLALILEVVILVLGLGLAALFFWVVWFVSVVAEYACKYLEALYTSAVASVVHTFGKLTEHLNMIIRRFATEPEEQTHELPQVISTMV